MDASADSGRVWPIPRDAEETAQQARAAVQRAFEAGITRQRIELLLPLIGATDLGIQRGNGRLTVPQLTCISLMLSVAFQWQAAESCTGPLLRCCLAPLTCR